MQVVTEYPLYNLPPSIETLIEERLKSYGFSIAQPKPIAEAVRTLSNLFIRGGAQLGYWHVPAMRAAYTAYFFPLNFLRARAVFLEAARLGYLEDIKSIEDWGCGAGSATWAALFSMPLSLKLKVMGYDQSGDVLSEFAFWSEKLLALHGSWPGRFQIKNQERNIKSLTQSKADTIILSYALAEVEEWPEVPPNLQNLVLIEPSTNQQGRKLLQYREKLLAEGWSAWAPCTHQYDCPLLVNSGKDWCHHRIHWNKPAWYDAIEAHLPMKNDTLTMSYLLLSKRPAPYFLHGLTRVVGDNQEELGKSRQMICRGPQREFMSWLHRDQYNIQLHRGDLIRLGEVVPKANELRVHAESILEPVTLTGDRYYDKKQQPKV